MMRQQRYVLALQSVAVLLAVLHRPASAFTAQTTRMHAASSSLGRLSSQSHASHAAAVNVRRMMVDKNSNDDENESSASAPPVSAASSSSSLNGSNDESDDESLLVTSRNPHKLKNKRGAFLGFRNAKDVPGWTEMRASSYAGSLKAAAAAANGQKSSTELQSQVQPLMPDGGLSPCVIRVLGVGGGGCNAVRLRYDTLHYVSIDILNIEQIIQYRNLSSETRSTFQS
jgi:hypothetical protein